VVPALQQAFTRKRDIATGHFARPAMGMRARPNAEFIGKLEILAADFHGRIFRPEKAERQRDLSMRRVLAAAQAECRFSRARDVAEVRLAGLPQSLDVAVDELRADAGLIEAVNGRITVLRRSIAMSPFINGGRATVQKVQSAEI